MKKHLIIFNPMAGKGRARNLLPQLEQMLLGHQLDFELVQTEFVGHAIALSRKGAQAGYTTVVAAGGDGTVNEVINGLMQARNAGEGTPQMGVLATGRGNDFTSGMDIPATLEEACQVLAKNVTRAIDIGWVKGENFPDGRYFGNGIGLGFDAVVGFEAAKMPYMNGLSYVVAALKIILFYYNTPKLEIKIDDQVLRQQTLMFSIMNGRRLGGAFITGPRSVVDDGLFDLMHYGRMSRRQMIALMPKVMEGTQESHPAVRAMRGKKLTIRALEGTIPAHADGETICEAGHYMEIELLSRQINLICRNPA